MRARELLLGDVGLGHPVQLGLHQRGHLVHPVRLAARVQAPVAGVGVPGGERIGVVGQAAALADLLEQPRGHATAQDGLHDAQGEAVRVRGGQRAAADEDVGLLDRLGDGVRAGPHPRGRGPGGVHGTTRGGQGFRGELPARGAQGGEDEAADLVVVEVAGGGDDELVRAVPVRVVPDHMVAGDGPDRLGRAADRPAEGVAVQHDLGELLVGHVHGVVRVHGELLEDHAALGLELVRVDQGGGEHVREDLHGHRQVLVQHAGVVDGGLLGRAGVGLPAHAVEGGRDVHRGARGRALEEQVLEEVRGAVALGRLVTGPDGHPVADGHRALVRHGLGEHADAAGQHGAAHHGTVALVRQHAVEVQGDLTVNSHAGHSRPCTTTAPHPSLGGMRRRRGHRAGHGRPGRIRPRSARTRSRPRSRPRRRTPPPPGRGRACRGRRSW